MDVMTDERSHTRDRLQDCTGMVGNSRKQCRGGQHKGPLPSDPPHCSGTHCREGGQENPLDSGRVLCPGLGGHGEVHVCNSVVGVLSRAVKLLLEEEEKGKHPHIVSTQKMAVCGLQGRACLSLTSKHTASVEALAICAPRGPATFLSA
jgi:hypothetical protein